MAEDGDAGALGSVLREQPLLGGSARAHELPEAGGVELLGAEATLAEVREREVHVVAAEEQVVSDGDALDGEGIRLRLG